MSEVVRPRIEELRSAQRRDYTMVIPWRPCPVDRNPDRATCECPYDGRIEMVNHQIGCPERMERVCLHKRDRDDLCDYALELERRATALCDAVSGGHADSDPITGSHNCNTCCKISDLAEPLRELLEQAKEANRG